MNILRKIFGGAGKRDSTPDGTVIKTYTDAEAGEYQPLAPMQYVDEIVRHFGRAYPDRKSSVFHEIVSDLVHIDVNLMGPTAQDPYWVLYTNGMSDLPMAMPDDMAEGLKKDYERAEVMLYLPEYWELDEKALLDENNYWPIRLLKKMARFPHEYRTWLGYGHTIPNTENYIPYADSTGLNGVVLYQLREELSVIHTEDGNTINVYFLLPIYREEMEYKLERGMDALIARLSKLGDQVLILNPHRQNTCL